MASVYELLGHGRWVEAQEAAGATVPDNVKNAPKPQPKAAATHTYGECAVGVSRCKVHRKVYRAMREKARKQASEAAASEARDLARQEAINRQRMARVAGAPTGVLPHGSSLKVGQQQREELPKVQLTPAQAMARMARASEAVAITVFCERGEHRKCDQEAKGEVHTSKGRRACRCEHHKPAAKPIPEPGPPPIKRDTKTRLRWEARTQCTEEERINAIVGLQS